MESSINFSVLFIISFSSYLILLFLEILFNDHQVFISTPFNYLAYMMIAFVGIQIFKKSISLPKVFGSSLLAGVIFFLVSNFSVWLHPLYVKSLWACYIEAIPFFRATLASNIFFSAVLFGGYYLLQKDFNPLKLEHIKYNSK